jgi:anti-sigma regulatory factor (Ser/Thr protein kinase)
VPSVRQRGRGRLAERRLPGAVAGGRAGRHATARPAGAAGRAQLGSGSLTGLRDLVSRHAAAAGLDSSRAADLVLAVDELATNSLRHGGGRGTLRIWRDDGTLVCEVRDAGRIENPMAGRERPPPERDGGRGLWMVNQLCDLVQLRSFPDGVTVRVHMYLP